MMEGALSGKTGFTGEAGYCYIGALQRDDRTFIVSLLACGWPNNKGYKWADTKKLMTYGIDFFHYQEVCRDVDTGTVPVQGGIPDGNRFNGTALVHTIAGQGGGSGTQTDGDESPEGVGKKILLRDDDEILVHVEKEESLDAPVSEGDPVGKIFYMLGDEVLFTRKIIADEAVEVRDYRWCLEKLGEIFFMRV